ncbi:uncharacterized protein LOC108595341 [Drosophila busckii]|uniref:uncharacterized protein LOC108595341 n=1 Tax=Drosophila busckii TaxID=30019 RepID=UPI00083F3C50|nr:uncharacterized protein LOC108595341 [Drosophila busckii]
MFALLNSVRKLNLPLVRHHGHPGGIPGLNMPFRKGMESPIRFTIFFVVLSVIGFGAPCLVFRHQMMRTVTYEEKPPEE